VHWARGDGETVDLHNLDVQREGDIMTDQLEAWMVGVLPDVAARAGEAVFSAQHLLFRIE
jgi:hypothetical protein